MNTRGMRLVGAGVALAVTTLGACGSAAVTGPDDQETAAAEAAASGTVDIAILSEKFGSGVDVTIEGDQLVIHSTDVPDHPSPYFGTGSASYEGYDGTNPHYMQNNFQITEQSMTYRIPRYPRTADQVSATPLGPIGVAVNGVAFFNQYAGNGQPLSFEINSFDQYNGHPQMSGVYHYHVEPLYITAERGSDALLGLLLDGFPVYGPVEDGKRLTNADLDAEHGHFGPTAEFPDGIYHYHVTDEAPYINGDGFHGERGSVTGR